MSNKENDDVKLTFRSAKEERSTRKAKAGNFSKSNCQQSLQHPQMKADHLNPSDPNSKESVAAAAMASRETCSSPNAAAAPAPKNDDPTPMLPLPKASNWDKVPRRNSKKLSPKTMARRLRRKYKQLKSTSSWYHTVAAQNRLGSIQEKAFWSDDEEEEEEEEIIAEMKDSPGIFARDHHHQQQQQQQKQPLPPLQQAKQDLLNVINKDMGDCNTPAFHEALQRLVQNYVPVPLEEDSYKNRGPRKHQPTAGVHHRPPPQLEGIGISAGKPSFPGCIGRNGDGDPLFKLGTMSFDMFCPTQLVVSVQGTFVLIDKVNGKDPHAIQYVPKELLAAVRSGSCPVRTYNIVTPFTIEPWKVEFGEDSPNKGIYEGNSDDPVPIRGIMTTYGFINPYPTQDHRFSVWFTGGSLEVAGGKDDGKNEKWFQIFDDKNNNNASIISKKRTMIESGKLLAAKIFMGASTNDKLDQDGKLSYTLTKPRANYIDLLYLDKKLQVLRGNSGTVYVHVRLPGSKVVQASAFSKASLPPLPSDASLLSDSFEGDNRVRLGEQPQPTLDLETQRKLQLLTQAGEFKQATELLQRSHSFQALNRWNPSRNDSSNNNKGKDVAPSHPPRRSQFPRSVSENNLHERPRAAREA